ncbi:MAG: superfamily drug/metabolite permease [Deltaproteobacteria bacterium]|nr:superfamily drug/metabolite permease [Deltaproteobacteria bacterium]
MLTENTKAIIAWLNVCVIWGTTYLVIRIGVGHLPPMLFAGIRWVIAGVVFITVLKWRGKALPKANEIVHLAVVGLALIGFGNGLVVFAEQWIPSGLAALLITTVPFFMVGIESFLPKGPKLNATIITGLAMGFVGASLIFGEDIRYLADPDNFHRRASSSEFRDQRPAFPCLPGNHRLSRRIHLLHLRNRQTAGLNLRLHQSSYCAIFGLAHSG